MYESHNAYLSATPDDFSGLSFRDVICQFSDGTFRNLLACVITDEEIFVVAMRQPGLGERLAIAFCGADGQATRGIEAMVVETSYRPSDAFRCGFHAVAVDRRNLFNNIENRPLVKVKECFTERTDKNPIERRKDPRIPTTLLKAKITIPGKELMGTVRNVSMSGVLISFGNAVPPEIDVRSLMLVEMFDQTKKINIEIKAEVVRLIGIGVASKAGLKLFDVTKETAQKLESLIVLILGQFEGEKPNSTLPSLLYSTTPF